MCRQSVAWNVIPSWLPFMAKTVGTVYLLEAPAILLLRTIVLIFVPSKIGWTETFHGFPMRTWTVVLAVARRLAAGATSGLVDLDRPRLSGGDTLFALYAAARSAVAGAGLL